MTGERNSLTFNQEFTATGDHSLPKVLTPFATATWSASQTYRLVETDRDPGRS
jgi:hypothetical protein